MTVRVEGFGKWEATRRIAAAMEGTDRVKQLRDDYLPRWREMGDARLRDEVKTAFVQAYRSTVHSRTSTYQQWIGYFELKPASYAKLASTRAEWPWLPVISVVMPTYETPIRLLRDAVESVMRQDYPHWELCIADDASRTPEVRRVLQE